MNRLERTILATYCVLTVPVTFICARLVISYLRSKAPGMQTFNDRVLIDFQRVLLICSIATLLPYAYGTLQLAPVSLEVALVISSITDLSIIMVSNYMTVFLIVKYISVYYGSVFSATCNETLVINGLRIGIVFAV
jgi:hypothetical protein